MQIKVLGAGGNIGNSGILVKDNSTTILLDYGLNPGKNIPPLTCKTQRLNCVDNDTRASRSYRL